MQSIGVHGGEVIGYHDDEVYAVSSSRDGKLVASACSTEIRVWDGPQTLYMALEGHTAVAFSPYHELLAFGGHENATVLMNTSSWTRLKTYSGHEAPVSAVAFSPDGYLASGSQSGRIRIWDSKRGGNIGRLEAGNDMCVTALAFSPSAGGLLASMFQDGTIRIWDINSDSEKLVKKLPGHGASDTALAFSPDGKVLASRGPDETIQIWDTKSWKPLKQFPRQTGCVITLAFSSDGKVLASAAYDGSIKIWDTKSWKCLATIPCVNGVELTRALAYVDDSTDSTDSTVVAGCGRSVELWSPLDSASSG